MYWKGYDKGYLHLSWRTSVSPHELFELELARSESPEVEMFYESFHKVAFPKMLYTKKVTDLSTQFTGIDREIHFTDRVLRVEEKCDEFADRMNICFEVEQAPGTTGWSMKHQASDVLLYTFWHQKVGYYFNTRRLLDWYQTNQDWLRCEGGYLFRYTEFGAKNQPIPVKTVAKYVTPLKVIEL